MKEYVNDIVAADLVKESEKNNACIICKSTSIIGKIHDKNVCNSCANDALELKV